MREYPQERNKMIHPSYVDLMNVVNKEVEEGEQPVINSRYSVVMATARRARQIIAGDEPMVRVKDRQKPLSIAVDEMNQAQLRILTDEEKEALKNQPEEAQDEEIEENE
jgi:DNA-directed RNA polymerase subunit omega